MLNIIKWAFTDAGELVKVISAIIAIILTFTLLGVLLELATSDYSWVAGLLLVSAVAGATIFVYDQYAKSTKGDDNEL